MLISSSQLMIYKNLIISPYISIYIASSLMYIYNIRNKFLVTNIISI